MVINLVCVSRRHMLFNLLAFLIYRLGNTICARGLFKLCVATTEC